MHFFHLILMLCAALVAADDSSDASSSSDSSSVSPTLVWVTGTNSLGVLQTSQSAYSQKFTTFYDQVASVPSGGLGLGSISGTVGHIREYSQTTINGAEGSQTSNLVVKVFPFISALLGLLWL